MRYRHVKNTIIAIESAVLYGFVAMPYGAKAQVITASILMMVCVLLALGNADRCHAENVRERRRKKIGA